MSKPKGMSKEMVPYILSEETAGAMVLQRLLRFTQSNGRICSYQIVVLNKFLEDDSLPILK